MLRREPVGQDPVSQKPVSQDPAAGSADRRTGHGPADHLRALVAAALAALDAGREDRPGPLPAGGPAAVRDRALAPLHGDPPPERGGLPSGRDALLPEGDGLLPERGAGETAALTELARMLAAGSADPADPWCAAHLHCPPLPVAVAADLVVSALNPSLDSWDQAPAATTVETEVVATLAALVGYDPRAATGTITTGGTESNLMGLLLARDALAGGPPPKVFCSAAAHHSVRRSAELLGLGRSAVVPVDTDADHRMDVAALRRALAAHPGPVVVVATAGTTDAGAVDPLARIADVLRSRSGRSGADGADGGDDAPGDAPGGARRCWLHVDAAYGGAALFSDRMAHLLDGIASADSVALDLHKLGWQPVPAGVFLTRDTDAWRGLAHEIAYLNPADDTAAGLVSLLGRSLRTTRRADAFKIAVTFRALGRRRLGAMVDACHDLARHAAATIDADPRLERAAPVSLSTVIFRYRPAVRTPVDEGAVRPTGPDRPDRLDRPDRPDRLNRPDQSDRSEQLDQLNAMLRRELLATGQAVVGRTELGPDRAVYLKLTLLNPEATTADVDALLALVARTGDRLAGAFR